MFSNKKIPSVGGSLGISRILGILEEKFKKSSTIRSNESLVLVSNIGKEQ
jgi:histidyl-tRNA synthetase